MPNSGKPPLDVVVTGASAPVPVEIIEDKSRTSVVTSSGNTVAAPTTTEEEDRATVGQRRINLIWEVTQAMIAIMVTAATLYVSSSLAIKGDGQTAAFLLLSNAFFVVITAYIQRTNHTKIGGVGKGQIGR